MASKYCGTVAEKQVMKTKITWDNVPLNQTCVGHLEIVCVKWRINAALAKTGHVSENAAVKCDKNKADPDETNEMSRDM